MPASATLPLFRLRAGAVDREATRASCLQPIAGKGCFAVAMISDFDKSLSEEGAFAYRRLHWEAGLIGQALYLWATAVGLAGTGIGCFFDDEVHALLGLPADDMQFQDVYHFTVGGGVEDARILTLPSLSGRAAAQMNIEIEKAHVEALIERFPAHAALATQLRFSDKICKRRSKNPSMKRPSWSVAPE